MNSSEPRLKALGNFIKSCRAKLTPASVGLPPGYNRRRIPGLRREEVAQLAGVSTTWYTWLEQGRDIHASKQILDCIGKALRLTPDEYIHMMNLAQFPVERAAAGQTVSSRVGKIIADLTYPAMVVTTRADVLAWNKAACAYFADFAPLPEIERNMIWQWFTNSELQARIANWEERSPYAVALFRGICDRHADDPWFAQFLGTLMQASPYFAKQWNRHEVKQKSGGVLEFAVAGAENESFEVTSFLNIDGDADVHLYVFTPCTNIE